MPARLSEDHRNARLMADLLSKTPLLEVEPEKVCTNILMVGVARSGFDSEQLAAALKENGVLVSLLDSARIRIVTHNDVSRDQIFQAAEIVQKMVAGKRR